jgi:hypothetical protein
MRILAKDRWEPDAVMPASTRAGALSTVPAAEMRQELLLAFQFIGQGARALDLAQRLDHACRVHRTCIPAFP